MNKIRCPLESSAETIGNSPAIITASETVTFERLEQLVHLTARALEKRGVTTDTCVALLGENSLAYCILILSLLRIGAVACPISQRLPKSQLRNSLIRIGCNLLIRINSRTRPIRLSGVREWACETFIPKLVEQTPFRTQPVMSLNHPATILFTSGSSSLPKAALLSYGNHYYSAVGANELIPFEKGHRWLLTLPLYHVGGLGILFRALVGGGAVVIPDKNEDMSKAFVKYEITHASFVPTQLRRIVGNDVLDLSDKHPVIIVGGEPVANELLHKAQNTGLSVYTTYGMTEMASQVTTGAFESDEHSGLPLQYRKLKIDDDGEILVQGETLFLGYIENGKVELPLDNEGWFHTGDLGHLDSKGHLIVSGRKDNMFISGGENIYPEEIESQLTRIEGLESAVVVGIPDQEFGQRPVAFVKFADKRRISEKKLVAALEKNLPRFKIPLFFFDWVDLPNENDLKPGREKFSEIARELTLSQRRKAPKASV